MTALQFSTSLDHIDNQELARLTGLWRAHHHQVRLKLAALLVVLLLNNNVAQA